MLTFGTTGTETPFLAESELPQHARLNSNQNENVTDEDRQLAEAISRSQQDTGEGFTHKEGTNHCVVQVNQESSITCALYLGIVHYVCFWPGELGIIHWLCFKGEQEIVLCVYLTGESSITHVLWLIEELSTVFVFIVHCVCITVELGITLYMHYTRELGIVFDYMCQTGNKETSIACVLQVTRNCPFCAFYRWTRKPP